MTPYIILDAKKATGKESLYLSAIGKRFKERAAEAKAARRARDGQQQQKTGSDTKSMASSGGGRSSNIGGKPHIGGGVGQQQQQEWEERVADAWPMFLKYFNGRSALERIALQEEMKRKDVWNLLTAMSEYLLTVRHW